MKQLKIRKVFPYLLLMPTLVTMGAFLAYPMIRNFYMSFFDWSLIGSVPPVFIGLENYKRALLTDFRAATAIRNTIIFTGVSVSIEFFLGLGIALLLNRLAIRGIRILRSILFAPMMITPIVVGLMWRFMWATDFGVINYFLGLIGIPMGTIDWLGNFSLAMVSCILTEIWQNTPFVTLILLAGLQALPLEPFEAARVDGASIWQEFRHITLPLLKPSIAIALFFRTMFTIRIFDTIWTLTGGGPADATLVLSILVYRTCFGFWHAGYSAALAWILCMITIAICYVYLRFVYREVEV